MAEYAEFQAKLFAKRGSQTPGIGRYAEDPHPLDQVGARRARQGDIFEPEVGPLFRRLIAEELRGPDGLQARKAVLEGNPGEEEDSVPVVVRINGEYPIGTSRSTVPPSVL